MKIIAQVEVTLPFALEYCADGPDVQSARGRIDGIDVSIAFPPSMGEKTDGRSFFSSGWAWWTGSLLSVELSRPVSDNDDDFDAIRAEFESSANEALRRFLNSYRVRFQKPGIYPVRVDPKKLDIVVEQADGSRSAFPESTAAFFYSSLPSSPPLTTSVNSNTLAQIQADLDDGNTIALSEQLALDAQWLESLGESERAARIKTLL